MSTFAVSMVKDEADVIAGCLTHMAGEVDHVIVADNGSTDGTREILAELEDCLPLTVLDDPDPAYYQSPKMSALAAKAGAEGADWVVPFDADEIWYWRGLPLREELAVLDAQICNAHLYNHFPSGVDPEGSDPFRTIVWRQTRPAPLPKVAFRWVEGAVIHQGNHGVTLPGNPATSFGIEIRHFPYRSAEQFVSKARNGAAAYRATDLPLDQGAHWRQYGDLLDRYGEEALQEVFRTHFWYLSPIDDGLIRDPAPYLRWQSPS